MSLNHVTRRVAVTGVATALAAGALVGAGATSATAAAGTNTYTCTTPVGVFPIATTLTLGDLPDTMQAGEQINTAFDAPMDFVANGDLAAALLTFPPSAVTTSGVDLPVGKSAVPVAGTALSGSSIPNPGELLINTTGATTGFKAPAAGVHDVTMPSSFTLVPTVAALGGAVEVPCSTSDEPAVLDQVEVLKNASATAAKATKRSFKKGTAAKIKSTVTGDVLTPAGKVVAKRGAKTYKATLNDAGVAVINLGSKLKPGKYSFAVKYLGSGYHKPSAATKSVVVRVVR